MERCPAHRKVTPVLIGCKTIHAIGRHPCLSIRVAMAIEIERRFLVHEPRAAFAAATSCHHFTQGYFGGVDGLRIRVRVVSDAGGDCAALLTFKGMRRGLCRLEYEYPLELDRARRALITLPSARIIRKIRYEIHHHDGLVWSVDRFQDPNNGLVLAEVELTHPDQQVEQPSWVGEEVTFDPRYGNSRLARFPLPSLPHALGVSAHAGFVNIETGSDGPMPIFS
jgi:CYTH domain-containing protein